MLHALGSVYKKLILEILNFRILLLQVFILLKLLQQLKEGNFHNSKLNYKILNELRSNECGQKNFPN